MRRKKLRRMFNVTERTAPGEPQYMQLKIIRRGIEAAISPAKRKQFLICALCGAIRSPAAGILQIRSECVALPH